MRRGYLNPAQLERVAATARSVADHAHRVMAAKNGGLVKIDPELGERLETLAS
jgi:hypothetical protein